MARKKLVAKVGERVKFKRGVALWVVDRRLENTFGRFPYYQKETKALRDSICLVRKKRDDLMDGPVVSVEIFHPWYQSLPAYLRKKHLWFPAYCFEACEQKLREEAKETLDYYALITGEL